MTNTYIKEYEKLEEYQNELKEIEKQQKELKKQYHRITLKIIEQQQRLLNMKGDN